MRKVLLLFLVLVLSSSVFASIKFGSQGSNIVYNDDKYVNETGDTMTGDLTTPNLYVVGQIEAGGLILKMYSASLADDASLDLPDATNGWGELLVGDNEERARFSWTTAGVVTLMENTATVVATDTDTNFCIFDNGTGVRIRNRLGVAKVVKYTINY